MFCKLNLPFQITKSMHLSSLLEQELLETCLKDEKANILVRTPQESVKWTCPAWVIPKKRAPGEAQSYRRVQDCRAINELLDEAPFKMEDWLQVRKVAKANMFATSLDFKSAFNLFPIDGNDVSNPENFAYYHCFKAAEIWWRPVGMLFGAKHSPFFFTMILQPVITHIRRKWAMDVIIYMDDMLLLHEDPTYLKKATEEVANLLLDLGIILSLEKCEVYPKQIITFLGWIWNFHKFTISMAPERRKTLLGKLAQWRRFIIRQRRVPIKKVQSLVGELAFLRPQLTRVLLYLKPFYTAIQAAVNQSGQSGSMILPRRLIHICKWFSKEIHFNTPASLAIPVPRAILVTDASEQGCGAILQYANLEYYMSELFSPPPPTSSNQREMLAVLLALKHFLPTLKENNLTTLTLESDNMTVVHNVSKVRAQKGPLPIVRALFSFLTKHRITLLPMHRPGVNNEKADALSRLEWMGDYEIDWKVVAPILQEWRITPSVDLFATWANHKLPLYCSPDPSDANALAFNAFSIPWAQFPWPYVHVTPALISTCLQRIQEERILALIVAPMWASQPWWDKLKRMTRTFRVLGRGEDILLPGREMKRRETKLPPGWLELAIVGPIGSEESGSDPLCVSSLRLPHSSTGKN
jgi:ribonuclease HI